MRTEYELRTGNGLRAGDGLRAEDERLAEDWLLAMLGLLGQPAPAPADMLRALDRCRETATLTGRGSQPPATG